MKKSPAEQPSTEIKTPLEIETKISKEESLDPLNFSKEEWESFLTALRLLAKKDPSGETGTLELKKDPVTGTESAMVYKNSDPEPVFMTKDASEIHYLKSPAENLEMIETDLLANKETENLIRDIKKERKPEKLN